VALFSKFFGKTIGEAAAFALGGAMRSPLEPPLVELTNDTWAKFVDAGITVPTEPGDAAEIAAERVAEREWAKDQAKQRGYGGEQMDKLIDAVLNAPGVALLFQLWRRGLITAAQFEHGLRKARLEDLWDGPLAGLHDVLLSSEELAMMQQQGFVDDARANDEGGLQGVTPERQQLRFEASGLPPGVETALEMLRRSIIDAETFAQIVREGHTKTKYTGELLALRERVLSATQYVEAHIRDWISEAEMHAGGALTGYAADDMDLLFKIHGRPISWHQTWIGLQRGGQLDGPTADIHPAFLASLRRSNIQPPFYNLAWAQRYNYPSAFVLRGMAQAGDLTQTELHQVLLYLGWEPTFADKVSQRWAASSEGGADALTKKAQVQLWTATHRAYVNAEMNTAEAHAELAAIGADADARAAVLALWNREREVVRLSLTASQIKRAFSDAIFTRDEAIARLERLGMTPADAATLLDE
jgi:hypothetical protein